MAHGSLIFCKLPSWARENSAESGLRLGAVLRMTSCAGGRYGAYLLARVNALGGGCACAGELFVGPQPLGGDRAITHPQFKVAHLRIWCSSAALRAVPLRRGQPDCLETAVRRELPQLHLQEEQMPQAVRVAHAYCDDLGTGRACPSTVLKSILGSEFNSSCNASRILSRAPACLPRLSIQRISGPLQMVVLSEKCSVVWKHLKLFIYMICSY